MAEIDRSLIEAAVREALGEILAEQPIPRPFRGDAPAPACDRPFRGDAPAPACDDGVCRPRGKPKGRPFDERELDRVTRATPARLAQGRTGTRYLTSVYIGLRAEHAIALDAVRSEVPPDLPEKLGCLSLQSRCQDREEYLLYPDHGRRLDDESRARLEKEGTRGADVQLILGDGLTAWALEENGPRLVPALIAALEQERFKVGRPLFVKFARVGVQDDIGVLLGAKATAIFVGERPGLGTGDSGSLYTAYAPRLNQDNAEKDCISNIRPLGLPPEEAAKECATLLRRTFQAGGGGTRLVRSGL